MLFSLDEMLHSQTLQDVSYADVGIRFDFGRSGSYSCMSSCDYYSCSETQEENDEFIRKGKFLKTQNRKKCI